MNDWRRCGWALACLVASAWCVGACGGTSTNTGSNTAGSNNVSGAGSSSAGGTTGRGGKDSIEPTPVTGMAGRAGSSPSAEGGAGGAMAGPTLPPGISDTPMTEMCPAQQCSSASVGPIFIDPCCAGDDCGLDTGFLALVGANFADQCQAKAQPGELDASCSPSAPALIPFPIGGQTLMVPINGFAGCCRDDGKCGVVADDIVSPLLGKVATLGLGCVDSAPFFAGEPSPACGAVGAGGAAAGGAGPVAEGGAAGGR